MLVQLGQESVALLGEGRGSPARWGCHRGRGDERRVGECDERMFGTWCSGIGGIFGSFVLSWK